VNYSLIWFICAFATILWQSAQARLIVSNSSPVQGETVEIFYEPVQADGNQLEARFNDHSYKFFELHGGSKILEREKNDKPVWGCLVAVPADIKPGKYLLNTGREMQLINVMDAKFPFQYLHLPVSKDNFEASAGERESIEKAKATLSNQRWWQGVFSEPCHARRSAAFGLKRVVNGKPLKDYFHSGLDFAAPLGKPVMACAPGKVILAHGDYQLHGNVIAIDHGQGVISFYIHLQKILVNEGDMVKAGQEIGKVGQTGRASGPHLHFSIYVNKTSANPIIWFQHAF